MGRGGFGRGGFGRGGMDAFDEMNAGPCKLSFISFILLSLLFLVTPN